MSVAQEKTTIGRQHATVDVRIVRSSGQNIAVDIETAEMDWTVTL